jgi:hypothetical protein
VARRRGVCARIAEQLRVSRQSIYNWAIRFQERDDLDITARLVDGERRGRPRTALGIIDPDEVIECDPRGPGYRPSVWTAPLATAVSGRSPSDYGVYRECSFSHRTSAHPVEAAPSSTGTTSRDMATSKRWLKRWLRERVRTVILMLDETMRSSQKSKKSQIWA